MFHQIKVPTHLLQVIYESSTPLPPLTPHTTPVLQHTYFFPKKDMMFPCSAFPPADFLPLEAGVGSVEAGNLAFGAGSSSEKDSQTGSSLVTERRGFLWLAGDGKM